MKLDITADEFDALVQYHQQEIEKAIQVQNDTAERYHEERIQYMIETVNRHVSSQ